jgi:hypothetical protein
MEKPAGTARPAAGGSVVGVGVGVGVAAGSLVGDPVGVGVGEVPGFAVAVATAVGFAVGVGVAAGFTVGADVGAAMPTVVFSLGAVLLAPPPPPPPQPARNASMPRSKVSGKPQRRFIVNSSYPRMRTIPRSHSRTKVHRKLLL